MGGGGGKGGGGSQTTNTTATPWSGVQPYLSQGYQNLASVYNRGAPSFYPGSTVAQMDPYTQAAIHGQAARAAAGSPLTTAAQGQLTDTMAGKYLDAGNPYFQGAVSAATRPVMENYQHNVLPEIDSAFSSAGRYGSGINAPAGDAPGHVGALGNAYTNMNREIGDISSRMAYQNYSDERNRQSQGMLFAPQLAQQDYFDINQLGASGSALDAYNQALINADIERYNYGQNADWQRTQDFINSLQAMPMGSSSTTRMPYNAFSSALGTGIGAAGLASSLGLFGGGGASLGSLAGLLAFSDERLKKDVKPVGMLYNGLPIYSYSYLWDDKPQIGVMAQDAMQVKPDAVYDVGGLLAVDYSKVTS